MSAEKWGWASIFAVGMCLLAIAFGVVVIASGWGADAHQAVAAWVQAVGSIAAIAVALGIALKQRADAALQANEDAKRRRQEPLKALRVLIDRAHYLVIEIPLHGDDEVERYLNDVLNVQAFATAQHALQSVPLSRLTYPAAVLSIFEMQDALHIAKRVLEPMEKDSLSGWLNWPNYVYQLGTAKTRANLARSHMFAALKEAEITEHLIHGSGSTKLEMEATGHGSIAIAPHPQHRKQLPAPLLPCGCRNDCAAYRARISSQSVRGSTQLGPHRG